MPAGLIFSYPVRVAGACDWEIVQGLELDEFSRAKIEATTEELLSEKDVVSDLLK